MTKVVKRRATLFWAALALLLPAAMNTAQAKKLCVVRDEAVAQLDTQFNEYTIGRGLTQNGQAVVELFISEGGTWTIVATNTAGLSCLVASGESWSTMPLLVGQIGSTTVGGRKISNRNSISRSEFCANGSACPSAPPNLRVSRKQTINGRK